MVSGEDVDAGESVDPATLELRRRTIGNDIEKALEEQEFVVPTADLPGRLREDAHQVGLAVDPLDRLIDVEHELAVQLDVAAVPRVGEVAADEDREVVVE
jgi:hypothetical protein